MIFVKHYYRDSLPAAKSPISVSAQASCSEVILAALTSTTHIFPVDSCCLALTTTSAVVTAIVFIVIAAAVLTVGYNALGF